MEITARTGPYKTRMRNRKIRHEALIYSSNQSSKYSFMNHPTGTIKNSEIVTPHGSTLFWAADDWRLHKDTSLTFRTVVVVPFPWFLRLAHWNGIFQHWVIPVINRTNSSCCKTIYNFTICHVFRMRRRAVYHCIKKEWSNYKTHTSPWIRMRGGEKKKQANKTVTETELR